MGQPHAAPLVTDRGEHSIATSPQRLYVVATVVGSPAGCHAQHVSGLSAHGHLEYGTDPPGGGRKPLRELDAVTRATKRP
jgi:hypothetical protein